MRVSETNSDILRGVRLVELEVFRDERGGLVALEEQTNLPFLLRRVFYVKHEGPLADHAASSDLMITLVTGSAVMEVDNGWDRLSMPLDGPWRGVWTRPGVHIRLRDLAPSTVLLVCASKPLEDTRYFSKPQPALIDAQVPAWS